ncbi:unnamed protein product [Caretta caretta]
MSRLPAPLQPWRADTAASLASGFNTWGFPGPGSWKQKFPHHPQDTQPWRDGQTDGRCWGSCSPGLGLSAGMGGNGKDCWIPVWGVAAMAGAGFVMLVVILVLSVCLCRARRRAKKLEAWKASAELEEPEVHYASLQNLALAQVGEQQLEPPGSHQTDYATVAELKGLGEECGEGAGQLDGGADPGELVREPQEGVAAN